MSIAVITGASSGLGVCYIDAVTKLFSEIDELWLIARREERLKEVAAKYPDKHCVIIPMDMADMSSFKILEEKLEANNPQIEVLINDAGMSIGSPFEDMELESMLKIIDLNCKGAKPPACNRPKDRCFEILKSSKERQSRLHYRSIL